jgi:putative transposase
LKKQNGGILEEGKDYPLILRNDVYKANTRLTPYWFRIPVAGICGKLNVPIGIPSEPSEGARMREAKLLKEGDDFYIYIAVEQEIVELEPTSVLGVDAGIHNIATTVNSFENRPRFYGRELRQNQAHFYHLRKKLQSKGLMGQLRR